MISGVSRQSVQLSVQNVRRASLSALLRSGLLANWTCVFSRTDILRRDVNLEMNISYAVHCECSLFNRSNVDSRG